MTKAAFMHGDRVHASFNGRIRNGKVVDCLNEERAEETGCERFYSVDWNSIGNSSIGHGKLLPGWEGDD